MDCVLKHIHLSLVRYLIFNSIACKNLCSFSFFVSIVLSNQIQFNKNDQQSQSMQFYTWKSLTWFADCNLAVKLCVMSYRRRLDLSICYLVRYWSNLNTVVPEDWVDVVYHFEKMWLGLALCIFNGRKINKKNGHDISFLCTNTSNWNGEMENAINV